MAESGKPKWAFYGGWILLSVVALPVGLALAFASTFSVAWVVGDTLRVAGQIHITEDFLLGYFFFVMFGLAIGSLQYLLLRRVFPKMGWWIAATVVGYVLPPVIGNFLIVGPLRALYMYPVWSAVAGFGLIGGSIGLAQWVVLRLHVRHAAWWIPLTAVGWATAGLIGGQTFGSLVDMVPAALLPPVVGCFGLWLLLDLLTGSGEPVSYPSERQPLGQS